MSNGTISSSFQEPTPAQQQREAFKFLRDKARAAHNEGDGLVVNQLSLVALSEMRKLAKSKTLHLQLHELRWAYVFAHYWLIDDYLLGTEIQESLECAPNCSAVDAAFLEALKSYNILIREPLWIPPETVPFLQNSHLDWVAADSPEDLALVENLVELLWYRGAQDEAWKEVLKSWSKLPALPIKCKELIARLDKRLTLQSSLTTPGQRFGPVRLQDAYRWKEEFPESELWIRALNGDRAGLNEAIARRLPFVSDNPVLVRLLLDFQQLFGMRPPKDAKVDDLDPQAIRLARRRLYENPLLKFNETREQRLSSLLGTIFQRDDAGQAYRRFHAFRLGMLSELAALRLWDFGEWEDSLRAQSNAGFEVTRWDKSLIEFAANGVRLSVIALCYESESKFVRKALDLLEFSPEELRKKLIQDLLFSYPLQGKHAVEALDDFSDAIPEMLWDRVADWCVRFFYEDWNTDEKSTGWKMLPLEFWADIFPFLAASSSIWGKLEPILEREAQNPLHWHKDGRGYFLHFFLYAPMEMARAVARIMLQVEGGDAIVRSRRFKTVRIACERRKEFANEFVSDLERTAETPLQKWRLNRKLLQNKVSPDVEREAKDALRRTLDEFLTRAKPGGTPSYPMWFDAESLAAIRWTEEDEVWLQLLLENINDPNVLVTAICPLLYALTALLQHGPESFSQRANDAVVAWLRNLPIWRADPNHKIGGPLSVMNWGREHAGEITNALAGVAYELRRKSGKDIDHALEEWLLDTTAKAETATGANLTQLALALTLTPHLMLVGDFEEQMRMLQQEAMLNASRSVLQFAWAEYQVDHNTVHDLFCNTRVISLLLRNADDNELKSTRADPQFFRSLLARLRPLLAQFATCPHPVIRAETATILRRFSVRLELPDELKTSLTNLSLDSRARVRRAATAEPNSD